MENEEKKTVKPYVQKLQRPSGAKWNAFLSGENVVTLLLSEWA